ncbi:MAG: hypothetical protein HKO95_14080 [Rhodobacteraceae bacterium]|nr:hypothetical protein [Alphaproteobacteria bacterium]MBT8474493.1 hypothetical protein [Alphaproteobacteria bacterium]NNK67851.1 hypothetical protein [Paracoccaceae bacterium]
MIHRVLLFISCLALAACSGSWAVDYDEPIDAEVSRDWRVDRVVVTIPDSLTLSEATSLYAPNADIVWHGDLAGDRRAQVKDILETGIGRAAARLNGSEPVTLAVVLQQFHAVTPAAVARAPSAVHNITYTVQIFDRNGDPLIEPTRIQADLEAYVGVSAILAAQQGQTQRVRITNHLDQVMTGWFGLGPDARRTFAGLGR